MSANSKNGAEVEEQKVDSANCSWCVSTSTGVHCGQASDCKTAKDLAHAMVADADMRDNTQQQQ